MRSGRQWVADVASHRGPRIGRLATHLLWSSVRHHPWDAGEGDADDPVDRAIAATRRAVFADHGLDHIDPR